MRRRDFIAGLGSAAAGPLAARAEQLAMPVIGFINGGTLDANTRNLAAFRVSPGETGHIEGQNVSIGAVAGAIAIAKPAVAHQWR
jgi:putative tryptophan/tyrosine transport system substrate-binding protein